MEVLIYNGIVIQGRIEETENEFIVYGEYNQTFPKNEFLEIIKTDFNFDMTKSYKYENGEIKVLLTKEDILEELNLLETKVSRTEEEIIKKLNLDMSTEKTGFTEYPTKDLLIKRKQDLRLQLSQLKWGEWLWVNVHMDIKITAQ